MQEKTFSIETYIFAFVDHLKDMEQIKGEEKLRVAVLQYFRGSSLIWHSTELSEQRRHCYNESI